MPSRILFLFAALVFLTSVYGQQVPDTAFVYPIARPHYAGGMGWRVVDIDAAHHNFHTLDGRYQAFGRLLAADGYRLRSHDQPFTPESLRDVRILVVSNALDSSDVGEWVLPNPSAFSPAEIATLRAWVEAGGRLFLIADHMPFAGAAADLGRAFGFEFLNGFAMDDRRRTYDRFYRSNGSLPDHPITTGMGPGTEVDTVVTFTGSAFRIPENAMPMLALVDHTVLLPETAWEFEEETPFLSGDGLYQGAAMHVGKGRIVVFGEAAMFSAQLAGPNRAPVGMNSPAARQNPQLLLNIIHWLDQQ